jgi:hypothetical protein
MKSDMNTFAELISNDEKFLQAALKSGDKDALKMYVNLKAVSLRAYFTSYARKFGLCRLLGINNIYDIGCGNHYQAYMLMSMDIYYTGIDYSDKIDFEEMNRAFAGLGNKKKFINEMYPCDVAPPPNNAAIASGWNYNRGGEGALKRFAKAVSKDFERIITNVTVDGMDAEDFITFWETSLPGYKVYKIGCDRLMYKAGYESCIFATRFQKDIDITESVGYEYADERFTVGSMYLEEICEKLHGI